MSGGECISVVVRCRPFNEKEKRENRSGIISIDGKSRQVTIKVPNSSNEDKTFTFDAVYDENTQQKLFYEESCFSLVENVLEGFNATIFAYGQTGCGKSWTMQGPSNPPELHGVIPNSFSHLFDHINSNTEAEFLVRCSYLEIYNEEIKDLLASDSKTRLKCEVHEDPVNGVFVKNLTDVVVATKADLQRMLDKGLQMRTVAATLMNDTSSRSHSIFTIVVEMSTKDENGEEHIRAGKLNLVDLAGSERQKKTGASGAQLKEGTKINLSLSALGNVISALSENKNKHIPYRDSKLTRLLQDSLGGNTKTLMVAAISPADYNFDETMSTLRYANRAKNITNRPKVNEDPKETMLREYKEEIERLKRLLEAQSGGATSVLVAPTTGIENENVQEQQNVQNTTDTAGSASNNASEEELAGRINDLQHKFMSHSERVLENHEDEGSNKNGEQHVIEESERVAQAAAYQERRLKAKKARDAKQAEMNKLLEEKDEEFEELLQMAANGQSQLEKLETKYNRLKRRHDRRVHTLEEELSDVREELYAQRQLMQDTLADQEADSKLYEAICRSMMSEKEFIRVCEKSRWDEEKGEWLIPYINRTGTPSPIQTPNTATSRIQSPGTLIPGFGPTGSGSRAGMKTFHTSTSLPQLNQSSLSLPQLDSLSASATSSVVTSDSNQSKTRMKESISLENITESLKPIQSKDKKKTKISLIKNTNSDAARLGEWGFGVAAESEEETDYFDDSFVDSEDRTSFLQVVGVPVTNDSPNPKNRQAIKKPSTGFSLPAI